MKSFLELTCCIVYYKKINDILNECKINLIFLYTSIYIYIYI